MFSGKTDLILRAIWFKILPI